ncbi:MAG: hypothetical protein FJ219_06630 [Ignavibacteria bacterium]|nr:hypothetical protein [Ignavibacteria bacterium]
MANNNQISGKPKTLKVLASNIINSIRNNQGESLSDIVLELQQLSEAPEQVVDTMVEFIITYQNRKSYSPEEMKNRIYRQCAVFSKHKLYELKARATLLLGSHYLATYKHFAESLRELIAVELIAQKHLGNNNMILCEALFTKGSIYLFQGNYEESTKAIEQAQSLGIFSTASHELQFKSHVNLARNFSLTQNVEKMKFHLEKAEQSYVHYQSVYDKAALYIRRADLLKYEQDWEGAFQALIEGLNFYKSTQFKLRVTEFLMEIGNLLSSEDYPQKSFDSSMQYFEQALEISRELKIERLEAKIVQDIWKTAYANKEWKLCAEKLIEFNNILENINQEELAIHIKKLEQFEREEQLKLLSVGKPSYNIDMIDEVVKLREENESLKKKNTNFQKILAELDSVVGKLSNTSKVRQSTVEELVNITRKSKRDISTLDAYLADCEELHPGFSRTMVTLIPSITQMQMKVAKLIRIGLNTQSIASVCGVTIKSIENHRMNLRKKGKLNQEQSLAAYIMALK